LKGVYYTDEAVQSFLGKWLGRTEPADKFLKPRFFD